jgi:chromosome partitioning protein
MAVITIANQKGGVAKTITSVNLAAGLAIAGKKVLLIDFDPQGNATTCLGIDRWSLDKSIYNVLVEDLEIEKAIINTSVKGLDIVPANIHLSGAEIELASRFKRENILKKKLEGLREFDFIIIDTPPSLGLLTVNALVAANTILVPIQTEYFAMEGMSNLLQIVNICKEDMLDSNLRLRFLLTMYDGRTNMSKEVVKQVREHFGKDVFDVVIPRSVKLAEAPSHGLPIFLYDAESPGAIAYGSLVKEVLQ